MYSDYRDSRPQQQTDQQSLLTNQVKRYDTSTLDTEEALAIEKKREIQEIETGITDLAETQRIMADLVQEAKPKLDEAGAFVDSAGVKVKEGNYQLKQASKNQRASRKWMCCIVVLLLVIGMLLLYHI